MSTANDLDGQTDSATDESSESSTLEPFTATPRVTRPEHSHRKRATTAPTHSNSPSGAEPVWRVRIPELAREFGFDAAGVTHAEIPAEHRAHLRRWLAQGSHGDMRWMADRAHLREDPRLLRPGSLSIISLRMNYWPVGRASGSDDPLTTPAIGGSQPRQHALASLAAKPASGHRHSATRLAAGHSSQLPENTSGTAIHDATWVLDRPGLGYISRYALGRDYHKVMRSRLKAFSAALAQAIGPFGYRVFTDSAPLLEKALAEQAGLGWIGKHTNLLSRDAGSWFFLGEVLTDLPPERLGGPAHGPPADHCGRCTACLDICPTQAFRGPRDLDARRCISYLTIEHAGGIPIELRAAIGNRIYGCDDCQLVCPWNRFAGIAVEPDFLVRHHLDAPSLAELLDWTEKQFLANTEGMAIRRIGFWRWQRNLIVAAGNALAGRRPIRSAAFERSNAGSLGDTVNSTMATTHPLSAESTRQLRTKLTELRAQLDDSLTEHTDWALAQRPEHKRRDTPQD